MKGTLRILRGKGEESRYEEYSVDMDDSATLLDALEYLRTGSVPDLIYRHSCHHGSCGTCAVRIDGVEKLACLTSLASLYDESDHIPTVEPLKGFEPYADIAVDPGKLFNSLPKDCIKTRDSEWVAGVRTLQDPRSYGDVHRPSGVDRFVRFEDCIECGACVSACPVQKPFMGPAALTALHCELIKNGERREELLARAALSDGVQACEKHFNCSKVCPRQVHPGKHIQLLREEY